MVREGVTMDLSISYEEIIMVMEEKYPRELEICTLTAFNQKQHAHILEIETQLRDLTTTVDTAEA